MYSVNRDPNYFTTPSVCESYRLADVNTASHSYKFSVDFRNTNRYCNLCPTTSAQSLSNPRIKIPLHKNIKSQNPNSYLIIVLGPFPFRQIDILKLCPGLDALRLPAILSSTNP